MQHHAMLLALAVVTGAATGLADAQTLTIPISPQNMSGESGHATLTAMGAQTRVEVQIDGAPAGVAQPEHIHKGSCAQLNPAPSYPLHPLVDGHSDTVVDVTLDALLQTPMAINVHQSTSDLGHYVACGDIRSMPMNKSMDMNQDMHKEMNKGMGY